MAPYLGPPATDRLSQDDAVNGKSGTSDFTPTNAAAQDANDSATTAAYEPIAIIGCGMRLPGNVDNADALFDFLDEKREGRCRVPSDRYNIDAFYASKKNGHVGTEHGYFLKDVDLAQVDTSFWSMTRKELEAMDPQQRLALEVVYECLQNSGTTDWKGKRIGSFFGSYGEDWANMQSKENQETGIYRITGTGDFVLANRIAYEFGLQGPSMTIRTACSSALTCLHQACLSIHAGDCESAIVGGTNLVLTPEMTVSMFQQGVLSPEGRCKTFDVSADGYGRGEGVVAVHIKRLRDAIRDNDPIRAIIRSSCANADGKTAGMSQPSSVSHAELIRRGHSLAGIDDLHRTAMIECHGTGTQIGDTLETAAVASIFGEQGVVIGSVKPNLGHSEGASGVTSIIKVMLELERSKILPNINFHEGNAKIPFAKARLTVPIKTMNWPPGKAERIGVNSFGIGGANAYVLLESAGEMGVVRPETATDINAEDHYLLTFSASNAESLRLTVQKHEEYLHANPSRLHDLSYTLNVRREPLSHRAFAVVTKGILHQPLQVSNDKQVVGETAAVSFVFTGQGAQWAQMSAELFDSNSVFQKSMAMMQAALQQCSDPPSWSLRDEILKPEGQSRLSLAEFSQPCCTAVQVALVDVLRAWGVQPAAVVGHSSGEIAAAYASNALSAPDAILVAYYRGKVSSEIHTAGSMAAVSLGRRKVEPYLVQGVVIGCVNSPSSVTLSGDTEALEQVTKAISNDHPGALVRKLRVGCAYHSHHMAAAAKSYQCYMRGISATSAKIPFYSAVRGGKLDDRLLDANYWVDNLVSPVLFSDALSELARNIPPASVILEIGPHAALAGPIRQVLQAEKSGHHQYTSTLNRGQDARTSLATCAGHLFQCGAKVDFAAMLSKRGQVLVDLPTYSWTRDGPYWAENRLSREYRFRRFPKHDILGSPVVETSSFNPAWRNMLSLDDVPWLRDHVVVDDVVFPGACYVAMAGEAVRQLTTATDYTIREFNIENALLLHEGVTTELITHLEPVQLTTTLDSAWYNFKISSLSMNSGARWTRHAFGQIRGGRSCPSISATPPIQASHRGVDTSHWYTAMKRVGLNYGPRFQCLADISAEANARTATARIRHLALREESTYALHPSALDCVLQLFSVAATHGQSRRLGQLSVPTYIEELYISSSRDDVRVSVIADVTTTGAITGSAFGNVGDEPTLELKNLTLSPLAGAADARETDTHAAAELFWKPDISFLDQGNLMQTAEDCSSSLNVLERMMLACAVECHLTLKSRRPKRKYLEKYLAWMNHVYEQAASSQYPGVVDSQQITALGSAGRCVLIEEAFQDLRHTTAWPHATAVHRLFSHMDSIMAGKTETLSVLMDDDLLGRIYDAVRLTDASQFFRLFAHMMPNLRILEIGAGTGATTASILETLSDKTLKHVRDYSTYTFTDISPAFLNQAKERFKNHTAVEYRVLDITKDPVEQGFTLNSFDLIVASNVLHAAPDLNETLVNVRKLLAPGGKLWLQELAPPTKWLNFIFGSLPGWWLGEEDGRILEPYIEPEQWETRLSQAGFDGIQATHHDGQVNATMIAGLKERTNKLRVTLLVRDQGSHAEGSHAVRGVLMELESRGYDVDVRRFGQPTPAGQYVVALLDAAGPFVYDMTEQEYTELNAFIVSASGAGILWVTGLAQLQCTNPNLGMILGLCRTFRKELSVNIATLEVENYKMAGCRAIADTLSMFARRDANDVTNHDMEWVFVDGKIQVGRYRWISVNDRLITQPSQTGDRRLDIKQRGSLKTLQWQQCQPRDPQDDEVQITVAAVGLNFKDVLIAMGILGGAEIEHAGLGVEAAGTVSKVGRAVMDIIPGDRCFVFCGGAFTTTLTTKSMHCVKIPGHLSFEEAASMPAVYSTVLYCLIDQARLEQNQSVLIHSACGGVGIAAIQICKHMEAEIFCTVGSEEKASHLVQTFGIPRDRIFNSRDMTFQRDIMSYTSGRGVDVVLNSLSGELLHASWQCVAEFGCMVEIGKRDLRGKGRLALDLFEKNRRYIGADLATIGARRPETMSRLLKETVSLYERGIITSINPLKVFDASKIEDAMRLMQKGSHMGKIVVTMPSTFEEMEAPPVKPSLSLNPDASYILVGGLGGLGRAVAVWMAEAGATQIIFLSRSASHHDRYASLVGELESLGCEAILVGGSVLDIAAVEDTITQATKPVRGVLQASMVLRDTSLSTMSFGDWNAAVGPKVQGTWNLHHALKRHGSSLDFFLLFSSTSGVLGQPGQANYSAANTFLDSFVQYRHTQGLPAAVIDIGPIAEIGFVGRNQSVEDQFRSSAIYLLQEQDLLDSIQLMISPDFQNPGSKTYKYDDLHLCKSQLAIGLRSTQPLSAPTNRHPMKTDARMAGYRNNEYHEDAASAGGNQELKQYLATIALDPSLLNTGEAATFIAEEIGKALFGFLMRDVSLVDLEQSPKTMGADSLVSIELRNWFKQNMGVDVTVLEILDAPTVHALGKHTANTLKTKLLGGGEAAKEEAEPTRGRYEKDWAMKAP